VLAGEGKVSYPGVWIDAGLISGDMAKGNLVPGGEIVLVLAGDHAGHAARTAGNVEGECVLVHGSAPFLLHVL